MTVTNRIPPVRPHAKVPKGENHPMWRGEAASVSAKRTRSWNRYEIGKCERCGKDGFDRHHIDSDLNNHSPENIAVYCRSCHMEIDGRKANLKKTLECRICGRDWGPFRHGRCERCSCYFVLHGTERPIDHPGRGQFSKKGRA